MEYAKHELVALETFLSYWPDGMSYGEVIQHLRDNEYPEDIDILGDFEDLNYDHIAQLIESLHDYLIKTYGGA